MSNNIQQFIETCRNKKLSVTPQRLAIYKALLSDRSHPNPESVYNQIKKDNPTISFATVYKTLETFEKHGIIAVVTSLHNTVRYDAFTQPHHHVVCIKCKKVFDLYDSELNDIKIPQEVMRLGNYINFNAHFNIICKECGNK